MVPETTTWEELAQETPLGHLVAVRDMSARAYIVAQMTSEGFKAVVYINDKAINEYGGGVHTHVMATCTQEVVDCWAKDMFTERMKRVRRRGDHGRIGHPVCRVRSSSAPD